MPESYDGYIYWEHGVEAKACVAGKLQGRIHIHFDADKVIARYDCRHECGLVILPEHVWEAVDKRGALRADPATLPKPKRNG